MGDSTSPLAQPDLIIDGEPNICSDNAEERQLARRLRIQRRLSATRKRQDKDSDTKERSIPGKATQQKTQLESQVESCSNDVFEIIDEGVEAVTNIKIAGNAHEVQKREEDRLAREERMKYLEKEAEIADEKYQEINKKWEAIAKFNDPLDLFEETERQKDKCKQLLEKKDVVIKRLQEELRMAELRFIKDQEKQSADMNLLVFRINEQIKIMRKVVKNQIALIEDGIEAERLEAIQTFNKKWESLNRQREKEQVNNLNSKLNSLEEHNQELKRIMLVHQEKFRDSKINLEENIQLLQREVESVKAVCLLNREKVDYNYQVLKKRDDENLIIKSQQKRRINKLQDAATNLRHKINIMEKNSKSEIKRLKSDVLTLYNKISAVEKKADHFSQVNFVKFNQVWKFNKDNAEDVLQKISEMDRFIHQQLLGLEWPRSESITSGNIALKDNENFEQVESAEEKPSNADVAEDNSTQRRKVFLVNKILKAVSNSSGFLLEERLAELLEPYAETEKLLVKLDNIFNALGVKDVNDVSILSNYLDPYLECSTCQAGHDVSVQSRAEEQHSPTSYVDGTNVLLDTHTGSERSEDPSGILTQIMNMVTQQVNMVHDVVSEVSSGMRKESSRYFRTPSADSIAYSLQQSVEDSEYYDKEEQDEKSVTLIRPKTTGLDDSSISRNPDHDLFIMSANVLHALEDFVSNTNEDKTFEMDGEEKLERSSSTKFDPTDMSKADVDAYWNNYKFVFTEDNEKLWDALMLGLRKYHAVLQDRHSLHTEVDQLSTQNNDLRRLLTSYTSNDSMKKEQSFFTDNPEHLLPLLSKDQNLVKLREVQDTLTRL
ncbi:hypothetical protein LSTR_LSTR004920 [Laodelphax striatellus]|uniref:Dynein regulatory complex protein 1 n=1 Tax=Laodelphax striatellus TaxID=195883 RepID=A0A482XPX0_LAOST|nr:hypothetical protein LSTR_LSTR004920 [Laodelphax striatellus]